MAAYKNHKIPSIEALQQDPRLSLITPLLKATQRTLDAISINADFQYGLARVVDAFMHTYRNKGRFFFMGNGGSASRPNHQAADITKRPVWAIAGALPIQAVSLSESSSIITMVGNDIGYGEIFRYQLRNFQPTPIDLVVGYSGSGISENVIAAMQYAKKQGATTIGVTFSGAKYQDDAGKKIHLADIVDIALVTPPDEFFALGTDQPGAAMGLWEGLSSVIDHVLLEQFRVAVKEMTNKASGR